LSENGERTKLIVVVLGFSLPPHLMAHMTIMIPTTKILIILKPRDGLRMTNNSMKCTYCGRWGHTIDERKLLYAWSIWNNKILL